MATKLPLTSRRRVSRAGGAAKALISGAVQAPGKTLRCKPRRSGARRDWSIETASRGRRRRGRGEGCGRTGTPRPAPVCLGARPQGMQASQEETEAAQAHQRSQRVRLKSQDSISLTVHTGKGKGCQPQVWARIRGKLEILRRR